eukprot:3379605-Rhodomonas_salina.2
MQTLPPIADRAAASLRHGQPVGISTASYSGHWVVQDATIPRINSKAAQLHHEPSSGSSSTDSTGPSRS